MRPLLKSTRLRHFPPTLCFDKSNSAYSPRVYWFEVFEVCRRLALSGILVLFGPGSTVQSAFSILVCFGSIVTYSVYTPLLDHTDNHLQ